MEETQVTRQYTQGKVSDELARSAIVGFLRNSRLKLALKRPGPRAGGGPSVRQ